MAATGRMLVSSGSRGRAVSTEFKGSHFERDVILWGVRWYVAYPISFRQLEEMMEERGVEDDHSTLNRWVIKYAPLLEQKFHTRKCSVGRSWRMEETYVNPSLTPPEKRRSLSISYRTKKSRVTLHSRRIG
jgi:hypothetical protein